MRTRVLAIAAMLLAAAPLAGAMSKAEAHAQLRSAIPAVGSTVATAPKEVTIVFSEGVEPAFCSIEVQDAAGHRVDVAAPHIAPGDQKRLAVDLGPLTPGLYTVAWKATSVDTHKTEGTFKFTVAP